MLVFFRPKQLHKVEHSKNILLLVLTKTTFGCILHSIKHTGATDKQFRWSGDTGQKQKSAPQDASLFKNLDIPNPEVVDLAGQVVVVVLAYAHQLFRS